MKICPECGSHDVIIFTCDYDFCRKCGRNFPAVKEIPDGIDRIAAERKRQIEKEGYTAEHDKQHSANALIEAALCYVGIVIRPLPDSEVPLIWPWDNEFWKPSPNPIRNLEKAGALIAAAIDRIQMEDKQS